MQEYGWWPCGTLGSMGQEPPVLHSMLSPEILPGLALSRATPIPLNTLHFNELHLHESLLSTSVFLSARP